MQTEQGTCQQCQRRTPRQLPRHPGDEGRIECVQQQIRPQIPTGAAAVYGVIQCVTGEQHGAIHAPLGVHGEGCGIEKEPRDLLQAANVRIVRYGMLVVVVESTGRR